MTEKTLVEEDVEAAAAEIVEETLPAATAPTLPWEIVLANSATFYQRLPGGAMILKFVPVLVGPQGAQIIPPGVVVSFSAEGWARFQEEVANEGEKKPTIQTATAIPKLAVPRGR